MKTSKTHLILTAIALMLTVSFSGNGVYAQDVSYDYYDDGNGYYTEYDENYNGGISFNVFYNELRPYGRWINHGVYGQVWIPNVERDFHPYKTNGYWVMTDYGNTWVSDFSWGWAPFHYGRWYYDDYFGWVWIPGYEWAPAWVVWRSGGGYYGWAAMGPGVNISININIPGVYWTFLPARYMYHPHMHKYYTRYSPAIYTRTTIINHTYVYNNNRYYSGPSSRDYEHTTGRKVTVHKLESSYNRSGRATTVRGSTVTVYRPDANSGRSSTSSSRSSSVTPQRTPSSNRSSTVKPQRKSSSSNLSSTVSLNTSRSNGKSAASSGRSSENSRSERSSSRR